MNFVNQALTQLRDLFESMTPGARLTSGLLLSVVVISLIYLVNFQSSGGNAYLMGGEMIPSSKLPAIQGALGKAQLSYEMDGMRIKIPRGQDHKYMAALMEAGALPTAAFGSYMQRALDSGSTFESKHQKAARIQHAKQMDLTAMINKMEGVQEASVFYEENRGKGLNRKTRATALVSIVPTMEDSFSQKQAQNLRKAIAAAYQALKTSDVTISVNGRVFGGGGDSSFAEASENPYLNTKQLYEKNLQEKILNALSFVSGVVVEVSAELDENISTRVRKQEYAPLAVSLQTTESKESKDRTQSRPQGPPGTQLNVSGANDPASLAAAGRANTTKETKSELSEHKVSDTTTSDIVGAGLVLRKAKVSVSVPSTHYLKIWRKQNPTDDGSDPAAPDKIDPKQLADALKKIQGEEDAKITEAAKQLLPTLTAGKDQLPNVVVVSFEASEPPAFEPPSMASTAMAWGSANWGTLSMFGLAMFCLLTVRSIVKSNSPPSGVPAQAAAAAEGQPSLSVVSADDEEEIEFDEEGKPKRRFASGSSVKDELADMVREDPDAAASILSNWLANAG